MPASPLDSAIYRGLFEDADLARLFTDTAEMRAMMLVLGALAKAQGAAGLIPEISAQAIHRASMELQIDPAALSRGVAQSAVPVPALVSAFREAMQAPEHARYLHWGATSQDIVDTGLALRLRQSLGLISDRLDVLLGHLAGLADAHADLPMAGRTWGQVAVPTSFGAMIADCGMPLVRQSERLPAVREGVARVSLSGAAGTLSAMGGGAPEIRRNLADALDLADPGGSWHTQRDGIATLAGWLTVTAGALGKLGEDIAFLTASGIAEIDLGGGGGSSTMPQKSNPVLPNLLVAIARHTAGLNAAMQSALLHRLQRDGASWMTEWLSLPSMVMLTGRALGAAGEIAAAMTPRASAMAANLDGGTGFVFAEALAFRLAETVPRPEAADEVKRLVAQATTEGRHLREVARRKHPDMDLDDVFDAASRLGEAPAIARRFAKAARTRS